MDDAMGDSDDEVSKQDQDRTNTTSSAPNTKRIICLVQADFNKMDQGNKRGPMSRLESAKWIYTNITSFKISILIFRFDFDTQEEYANYKSQQEAMPKVGERAS